jgi:hypothetical protein
MSQRLRSPEQLCGSSLALFFNKGFQGASAFGPAADFLETANDIDGLLPVFFDVINRNQAGNAPVVQCDGNVLMVQLHVVEEPAEMGFCFEGAYCFHDELDSNWFNKLV